MTDRVSFKDIVLRWRDHEFGGRVPCNDREARVNGYLNLFETLLGAGYQAFEIFMPTNKGIIIGLSHNPNHVNKSKPRARETWRELAEEDLDTAKGRHSAWPKVEMKKFDPDKSNYQPGTPTVYVKKEEPVAVTPEPVVETPSEELAPTTEEPRQFREFTKEEWDKIPDIKVEYHPELRKLLGFDDE